MTAAAESLPQARTVRLIHASLVAGQLLFLAVAYFRDRSLDSAGQTFGAIPIAALFGFSVVACAVALLLRGRVPKRPTDASADLYWTTAQPRAMAAWIPLEVASLLALVAYFQGVAALSLLAAAIPMALLVALNPWYLERR